MPRTKITLIGASLVAMAAAAVAPLPVQGQFAQYTQPGGGAGGGTELTREAFEQALDEALWNLGPVRLSPWAGIRDLRWSTNPLGRPDEAEPGGRGNDDGGLTVAGGAGLRAHLPTGHNVFWTVHALPEYQWWQDQDDRNRLNGRYGAGVFGFFNRLTIEASGRREEQLGVVSAELPQEVNHRQDTFRLASELHLGFATSLFAELSENRTRAALEDVEREAAGELRALDRDERAVRAGVRYRPRDRWTFGVGMAWTESESVGGVRDLSTTGTAPTVEVAYTGPKFYARTAAELRSLEAEEGSEFRDTDTETYSVELGLEGNRLSPALYARRSLALAVSEQFSHFTSDVYGGSAGLNLGYRTSLRAFAETGENEFVLGQGAEGPARTDDVTSYGVDLTFRIGRVNFQLGGYRTEIDSNLPGEDRTLEVLHSGISFGLGDLSWGQSGSGWL